MQQRIAKCCKLSQVVLSYFLAKMCCPYMVNPSWVALHRPRWLVAMCLQKACKTYLFTSFMNFHHSLSISTSHLRPWLQLELKKWKQNCVIFQDFIYRSLTRIGLYLSLTVSLNIYLITMSMRLASIPLPTYGICL